MTGSQEGDGAICRQRLKVQDEGVQRTRLCGPWRGGTLDWASLCISRELAVWVLHNWLGIILFLFQSKLIQLVKNLEVPRDRCCREWCALSDFRAPGVFGGVDSSLPVIGT